MFVSTYPTRDALQANKHYPHREQSINSERVQDTFVKMLEEILKTGSKKTYAEAAAAATECLF